MKNKLNKFITASLLAILLAGGLASAQDATDTSVTTQSNNPVVSNWDNGYGRDYGMMDTGNWQNFRGNHMYSDKGWESIMPAFAAGFIGLGIVASIIGLLAIAFWIWMLVHAASSDIKFKPLWLLVIWFMHIIGAIIYFFAIKRKYDAEMMEEECMCGHCGHEEELHHENTCACGKNEKCMCHEKAHQEHHAE